MISMMQKDEYTFLQAARRKRFDRILQISILTTILGGIAKTSQWTITKLYNMLGKKNATIMTTTLLGTMIASMFVRKVMAKYFVPGLAVADVLNKTQATNKNSNKSTMSRNDDKDESLKEKKSPLRSKSMKTSTTTETAAPIAKT
mmetsp:Transcript_33722/g.77812  ORF Transcript_33722/g.77812 Transcript_33722/m.77812 type:complete len:145 (+) Transcript_33722:244-678(+)